MNIDRSTLPVELLTSSVSVGTTSHREGAEAAQRLKSQPFCFVMF